MSLPKSKVDKIRFECRASIEEEMKGNKKKVKEKRQQLAENEEKLFTVEEKWIKNEINKDTYDRWYSTYSGTILDLKGAIERLNKNQNLAYTILEKNLEYLTDMRSIYLKADTLQKREFVNQVFDNNLYYENGIYRTPIMMNMFTHNHLKMKVKGHLIYKKIEEFPKEIPLSEVRGIAVEHLVPFLMFFG